MKYNEIIAGFACYGMHCGIKSDAKKPDLGIIFATQPTTKIAGVFTQNKIKAAPVKWRAKNLKAGKNSGRLIAVNSGNANAATGKQGEVDNSTIAKAAAKLPSTPLKLNVGTSSKIRDRQALLKDMQNYGIARPMSEKKAPDKPAIH